MDLLEKAALLPAITCGRPDGSFLDPRVDQTDFGR